MKSTVFAILISAATVLDGGVKANAAEPLKIAAAADLRPILDKIITAYQTKFTDHKVAVTYGGSGKLSTQIQADAPFDLFLSADPEQTQKLIATGHGQGTSFAYAHGQLAMWIENGISPLPTFKLKNLENPKIKKIAIANPLHAPYGKIAISALKKSGNFEQTKDRFVFGDNVAQTLEFVESGAAQVGFVASHMVADPAFAKKGTRVEIESSLYPPLIQTGLVLNTTQSDAAKRFRDFLLSTEGQAILNKNGLKSVEVDGK